MSIARVCQSAVPGNTEPRVVLLGVPSPHSLQSNKYKIIIGKKTK